MSWLFLLNIYVFQIFFFNRHKLSSQKENVYTKAFNLRGTSMFKLKINNYNNLSFPR